MADPVIRQKLDSLARCVDRVVEKRPDRRDDLEGDIDRQDIILINLERAVQLSVDTALLVLSTMKHPVPSSMGDTFTALNEAGVLTGPTASAMKKSVGFRNVAVHAYRSIDWQIVWSIITDHLDTFKTFAREILAVDG